MEEGIKFLLEQYGLVGLIITGLASFVMYEVKQHRKERDEWKAQAKSQHKEVVHTSIKFNETISRNTSAVEGLKTLLESMDRRINGD